MDDVKFPRLERHRIGGTGKKMQLSYNRPRSPSGKAYHYSPNPDAVPRLFLLGDAPEDRAVADANRYRIRREPGPGDTICPYSGHIGADGDFVHPADLEAIKKQALWEATSDIQDHLAKWAKDFNRKQPRGGFLKLSMKFRPRTSARPFAIREDLLRDLECDVCRRAYAVYAISLFCPDCGAPNLSLHFQREVTLVQEQISIADQKSEEGRREIAYRLMGNAHEDVLTAFETTLKTVYRHLVRQQRPGQATPLADKASIGNAFQNVERAREKFSDLSIDPFKGLTADDLSILETNIQKRHVIGHNLGIADDRYSELTQREQPGQTVGLIGEEIRRFAEVCLAVVTCLEEPLLPKNEEKTTDETKNPGGHP